MGVDGRLVYRFEHPVPGLLEALTALHAPWGETPEGLATGWLRLPDPPRQRLGDLARPMPAEQALGLLAALLEALAPLHARGAYHGALIPERLALSSEGLVLLHDLGAAWAARDTPLGLSTRGFTALFPIPWLTPPEVLGQRAQLSAKTDVFLAAALAHLWLTGRPAHGVGRALQVYDLMARGIRTTSWDGVPAGVGRALDAALEPDPAGRPEALELRRALDGTPRPQVAALGLPGPATTYASRFAEKALAPAMLAGPAELQKHLERTVSSMLAGEAAPRRAPRPTFANPTLWLAALGAAAFFFARDACLPERWRGETVTLPATRSPSPAPGRPRARAVPRGARRVVVDTPLPRPRASLEPSPGPP